MKFRSYLMSRPSGLEVFNILTGEVEGIDFSNPKICHGGKGGGSGGGTNTVTSNSAPPPEVMAAYQTALNAAQTASSAPLQQYGGPTIAGFTPDQQTAFNTVNQAGGMAAPYINDAKGMITAGTAPVQNGVMDYNQQNLSQFTNPYTQQVLNAQIGLEQNQDAQQQQGLMGNIISKGAWGGDRAGVAQSILAGQQALANNSTNANILNSGFQQGVNQFNTQNQQTIGTNEANNYLQQQGAFGMANLGQQSLQNALTSASAQLQTGGMQQQLGQAALNVPYQQFLQQQGYPFQTAQYYANIAEGIGSGAGGTSNSTSTSPGPSTSSQIFGGILGAAGLALPFFMMNRGGRIGGMARGGRLVKGYASGGEIQDDIPNLSVSYIPVTSSTKAGSGPPTPPTVQAPKQQSAGTPDLSGLGKLLAAATKSDPTAGLTGMAPNIQDIWGTGMANGDSFGDIAKMAASQGGIDNFLSGAGGGGGLASLFSLWRARGGRVGYDNGGAVGGGMGAVAIDPNRTNDAWAAGLAKLQARFLPGAMGTSQNPTTTTRAPQQFAIGGDVNDDVSGIYIDEPAPSGMGMMSSADALSSSQIPNAGISPVPLSALQQLPMKGGMGKGPPPPPTLMPALQADPAQAVGPSPGSTLGGLAQAAMGAPDVGGPPDPGMFQVASADTGDGNNYPPVDDKYISELNSRVHAKADPYAALAEAGFAMMAGKSPYALENIGAGALQGVKSYQEQRKQADTVNNNVDKLLEEARYHREQMAVQHQNADTNEAYRRDLIKQKGLIKDAFGNPVGVYDPSTQSMISLNNDGGGPTPRDGKGKVIPNINYSFEAPMGEDGKPVTGEAYLPYLPPQMRTTVPLVARGDQAVSPYKALSDPKTMAVLSAAKIYDPTYVGTRNQTIKDFAGADRVLARTQQAQGVSMEHIDALRDLVAAVNNKSDIQTVNKYINKVEETMGNPDVTNFNLGANVVGDELSKAIIGGTQSVTDRQSFKEGLVNWASRAQSAGQIKTAERLMAGQSYGLEQRYRSGTNLDNYRDRFAPPRARELLDEFYPRGGAKENPVPSADQREVGKTYNTPKGPLIWQGNGWAKP